MEGYKKFLFLPSGGQMGYKPHAWLYPITFEYQFAQIDKTSNSLFEGFCSLVERNAILPVEITELSIQDFYFIISYFFSTDLFPKSDFAIYDSCNGCSKTNKINILFGNLNYNGLHQWADPVLYTKIHFKDYCITFRHRYVKDNLEYSNLQMLYNTDNVIMSIIFLIIPLIAEFTIGGKLIETSEYINALTVLRQKDILQIYNEYQNFIFSYGLDNRIDYNCLYCGRENSTILFNDLQVARNYPDPVNMQNIEDLFKGFFFLARLPILKYDDVLYRLPIKHYDVISKVIQEMDFKSGVVMT
jgi:hypothetical protein